MQPYDDRPYIYRNPVKSMILAAIFLSVAGIVLIFTVVGSIIGVPLLLLGVVFGAVAWTKHRRRPNAEPL
jgi:drug/metabolite transporter (DMT)-like permease